MDKRKYLLTLVLGAWCALAMAQTRITGHVASASEGPIVMANVVEKDANNRNVSATQTDANGNFSLTIKSTANSLQISYIGYTTETIKPIGERRTFDIELKDKNTFDAATVVAVRKTQSNGLAIPEREISVAKQTLNMDDMQGLSFETAGEALQGQIAGLDIVMNSGNLGAGTSMRLRGVSSINGSQEPLIVVNGYILEDYDRSELDLNNMENEEQFATLLQVNPEDIQSINVLKDAAATAIWGARGSNGVIEITTRRGARGKTRVNFSYRFSGSWQPEGMKMLNGDGYTMMLKEAYFNPRQSDIASGIVELMYDPYAYAYYENFNKNTNWIKEVTQFGQTHNFGVAISGGGEKATFRVSGSYDHETGTIIKQRLDRFTTRLALDYWVSDRIKFSSDFGLTYTKNNKNYVDNLLNNAYQAMPNMSVYRYEYDHDARMYNNTGEYFIMPPRADAPGYSNAVDRGRSSYYLEDMVNNGNPVATAMYAWRKWSTYTITPQFSLEYKLLGKEEGETQLNYTGEVYMNAYTDSRDSYYPHQLTSKSWADGVDLTSNSEFKSLAFRTKHQLVFKPVFSNEDHALQVLARFEMGTDNSTSQNHSSSGINGGITDPTVPGYLTSYSSGTGKGHTMSGTGSMHYSFGSKYSFDFTIRADGSTKFGSGSKWGFFPGISGRWNISDEKFFEPLHKVVTMLAVRPGWGITGNQPWQEGLAFNKYTESGTYNGVSAMIPSNLRMSQLKWEKTKSWNLGFNLSLFDLIDFDLNIYNKKTSDLLNASVRIPSSTGYSYLDWANVGTMKNEGWELYVNTRDLFKIGKGEDKFSMRVRLNFAQNINTIIDMDESVLNSQNKDFDYANESILRRVQIGNALGGIYGFRNKGIYAFDYDHNGYFLNDNKNQYYDADGNQNTARAKGMTAPIAHDANGNVIYDKNGNPLPMMFNYGGTNYQFQGGDVIYEDINHDGQIDELDIVYLGGSNPKINGGFGIDFIFGNWQLKTQFNYRFGNKILNLARMYAEDMRTNRNQAASVNHRWRKNGQLTEIPRAMNSSAGESYNALVNDRYVEKGDFLRFQYVQLSYRVPAKKLKKYGLSSMSISASGNNLIFWTKYTGTDPEHSAYGFNPCTDTSSTPRSRYFTLSVNLGF
ncbi:MAG: SusC/RagA family TonB-linked outer membrane protein [Alloprevotella sp.]|nr:SusC/RagA family TonB-linked outer membrane protein [Alloprevotella sp.]